VVGAGISLISVQYYFNSTTALFDIIVLDFQCMLNIYSKLYIAKITAAYWQKKLPIFRHFLA